MSYPWRRPHRQAFETPRHRTGKCIECGAALPASRAILCDKICATKWRAKFMDPFSQGRAALHLKRATPSEEIVEMGPEPVA